ncbi:MAG TPA: hypothetical protein PLD59_01465 [Tepidisphaeraceae bacterium]|nr:hypothetical protein [Tepidisphaeraceae bacterium]
MNKLLIGMALGIVSAARLGVAEPVQPPAAAQPEVQTQFVRFLEDVSGKSVLETAETSYLRADDGVTVTLIGAVHIADEDYFRGLNASFDHYDALLYEMIKPKNANPTPEEIKQKRKSAGMIGWVGPMQKFMQENLDLAYQLNAIEYDDRANFVHADLDAETFLELQEQRNEGFVKLFIRAYRSEYKKQKAGTSTAAEMTPFHLLAALGAGEDRPRKLKLLFAKQLGSLEGQMEAFEGPNGSVIITERNKHCLAVLETEIAAGKKNIGIFYGAGHFPDMEKRLKQSGFERTGQTWRTAWNLTAPPSTQPVE